MEVWTHLIILILTLTNCHGLKCYVCNSAHDQGCEESPPPEKYLKECSSKTAKPVFQGIIGDNRNFTIILDREHIDDNEDTLHFTNCRKDDATIPHQYFSEDFWKEGTRRILRSCGWLGKPLNKCKMVSHEPILLIECSCTQDNCNTGHHPSIPRVLSLLSIVISFKFL